MEFKSEREMEEIVSAYELVEYPDYSYSLFDAVFRTTKCVVNLGRGSYICENHTKLKTFVVEEADLKDIENCDLRSNVDNYFLSNIGIVVGLKYGHVKVQWASGSINEMERGWLKKVHQEWSILKKDLPETIYVRAYEDRMNLLRASIIGISGTLYHDGLFFFTSTSADYIPTSHQYCTTTLVDFVPILTYTRQERFVLVSSIHGEDPMIGKLEGDKNSVSYNENAFLLSCRSMLYILNKPPKHVEELVDQHFRKRSIDILSACWAYMQGATVGYPFGGSGNKNAEQETQKRKLNGFQDHAWKTLAYAHAWKHFLKRVLTASICRSSQNLGPCVCFINFCQQLALLLHYVCVK